MSSRESSSVTGWIVSLSSIALLVVVCGYFAPLVNQHLDLAAKDRRVLERAVRQLESLEGRLKSIERQAREREQLEKLAQVTSDPREMRAIGRLRIARAEKDPVARVQFLASVVSEFAGTEAGKQAMQDLKAFGKP